MIAILGARVGRVDRPTDDLCSLEIAAGERAVLLLSIAPSASGVGLVAARPRGRPVDAFGSLLRKHLEGSTIASVEEAASGVRVVFATASGPLALDAVAARGERGFRLSDSDAKRLGSSGGRFPELAETSPTDETTLVARGAAIVTGSAAATLDARRRAALLAVGRAISRSRRKEQAIARDAARAETVSVLRHEADLLCAFAGDDAPGRGAIVVADWSTDPPENRTIALDPSAGPRSAAERRYREAKRIERGTAIAKQRLATTEAQTVALEAIEIALKDTAEPRDLDAIEERLTALGLGVGPRAAAPGTKSKATPRIPYRVFRSARGVAIWVGKNAVDNDELTVRVAKPHHLFLHARGVSGSHVIVALSKGSTCDEATLVDAATLAAHFSGVRGEPSAEVQYVPRKYVRKRRGSAPGSVELDREKVMIVRVEPARLRRLLASESPIG